MSLAVLVTDLDGTQALGGRLAACLFPGAVVALIGPMGAGKTHFVKAVGEGLCIRNSAVVNSPTFVLIQEYAARLPIYHFDAYRLASEAEFADLGVHEYFQGGGAYLVEWAGPFDPLVSQIDARAKGKTHGHLFHERIITTWTDSLSTMQQGP